MRGEAAAVAAGYSNMQRNPALNAIGRLNVQRIILAASASCSLFLVVASTAAAAEPHVIRITLKADADGGLAELLLNGEIVTPSKDGKRNRLEVLQSRVRGLVEDSAGRRKDMEFEAEVRVDSKSLKYMHVIEVLTAIRGYKPEADGKTVDLITSIRFTPPRD